MSLAISAALTGSGITEFSHEAAEPGFEAEPGAIDILPSPEGVPDNAFMALAALGHLRFLKAGEYGIAKIPGLRHALFLLTHGTVAQVDRRASARFISSVLNPAFKTDPVGIALQFLH